MFYMQDYERRSHFFRSRECWIDSLFSREVLFSITEQSLL